MPRGPKGERRPADVIANTVKVMRIGTDEQAESLADDRKIAAAVAHGKRCGTTRATSIAP
jgi:hypothetical protein